MATIAGTAFMRSNGGRDPHVCKGGGGSGGVQGCMRCRDSKLRSKNNIVIFPTAYINNLLVIIYVVFQQFQVHRRCIVPVQHVGRVNGRGVGGGAC